MSREDLQSNKPKNFQNPRNVATYFISLNQDGLFLHGPLSFQWFREGGSIRKPCWEGVAGALDHKSDEEASKEYGKFATEFTLDEFRIATAQLREFEEESHGLHVGLLFFNREEFETLERGDKIAAIARILKDKKRVAQFWDENSGTLVNFIGAHPPGNPGELQKKFKAIFDEKLKNQQFKGSNEFESKGFLTLKYSDVKKQLEQLTEKLVGIGFPVLRHNNGITEFPMYERDYKTGSLVATEKERVPVKDSIAFRDVVAKTLPKILPTLEKMMPFNSSDSLCLFDPEKNTECHDLSKLESLEITHPIKHKFLEKNIISALLDGKGTFSFKDLAFAYALHIIEGAETIIIQANNAEFAEKISSALKALEIQCVVDLSENQIAIPKESCELFLKFYEEVAEKIKTEGRGILDVNVIERMLIQDTEKSVEKFNPKIVGSMFEGVENNKKQVFKMDHQGKPSILSVEKIENNSITILFSGLAPAAIVAEHLENQGKLKFSKKGAEIIIIPDSLEAFMSDYQIKSEQGKYSKEESELKIEKRKSQFGKGGIREVAHGKLKINDRVIEQITITAAGYHASQAVRNELRQLGIEKDLEGRGPLYITDPSDIATFLRCYDLARENLDIDLNKKIAEDEIDVNNNNQQTYRPYIYILGKNIMNILDAAKLGAFKDPKKVTAEELVEYFENEHGISVEVTAGRASFNFYSKGTTNFDTLHKKLFSILNEKKIEEEQAKKILSEGQEEQKISDNPQILFKNKNRNDPVTALKKTKTEPAADDKPNEEAKASSLSLNK